MVRPRRPALLSDVMSLSDTTGPATADRVTSDPAAAALTDGGAVCSDAGVPPAADDARGQERSDAGSDDRDDDVPSSNGKPADVVDDDAVDIEWPRRDSLSAWGADSADEFGQDDTERSGRSLAVAPEMDVLEREVRAAAPWGGWVASLEMSCASVVRCHPRP